MYYTSLPVIQYYAILLSLISMQVHSYGFINFGSLDSDIRPFPLLISTSDNNIIAPFWDYYDNRGGGQVLFRLSDNQALLNEVGSTITDTLEFDFTPTMLFIATWDRLSEPLFEGSHYQV